MATNSVCPALNCRVESVLRNRKGRGSRWDEKLEQRHRSIKYKVGPSDKLAGLMNCAQCGRKARKKP